MGLDLLDEAVQRRADGTGPLRHRYYAVRIKGSRDATTRAAKAWSRVISTKVIPCEVTVLKTRGPGRLAPAR